MATYRARCWLGSSSGYQELEVQSNTIQGAKEQFQRIYGAEQIINLREVHNSLTSGSSSFGGSLSTLMWLAALFVIISYWQIILPIVAIILIVKTITWFLSL